MSEFPPQLRLLRDFYYKKVLSLPAEAEQVHAPGLIAKPAFFTLAHLQRHLCNPLLTPAWFALMWQGRAVDCLRAIDRKPVQKGELSFFNENIIEDYLARGASLMLRGMEFFEPVINAMCGAIDTPHQCVSSSATAFFIQRTDDSYYRLTDAHDTMVLQLAGQSTWRIFKRFTLQPAGDHATGIVMNPGMPCI